MQNNRTFELGWCKSSFLGPDSLLSDSDPPRSCTGSQLAASERTRSLPNELSCCGRGSQKAAQTAEEWWKRVARLLMSCKAAGSVIMDAVRIAEPRGTSRTRAESVDAAWMVAGSLRWTWVAAGRQTTDRTWWERHVAGSSAHLRPGRPGKPGAFLVMFEMRRYYVSSSDVMPRSACRREPASASGRAAVSVWAGWPAGGAMAPNSGKGKEMIILTFIVLSITVAVAVELETFLNTSFLKTETQWCRTTPFSCGAEWDVPLYCSERCFSSNNTLTPSSRPVRTPDNRKLYEFITSKSPNPPLLMESDDIVDHSRGTTGADSRWHVEAERSSVIIKNAAPKNDRPREAPAKPCPKKWLFEGDFLQFPYPKSGLDTDVSGEKLRN
ncbi:hypothetical protein GGX14DRAFT_608751 [Mycena pura]|uniref:Uncharacterized protein n=1 Tax=Mycena pura TaxID=153505 RepID=A0AAD6UKK6_9AGAR|nr:hypothetical protein GGX14DRAFT_608751 [Mycena pura]